MGIQTEMVLLQMSLTRQLLRATFEYTQRRTMVICV